MSHRFVDSPELARRREIRRDHDRNARSLRADTRRDHFRRAVALRAARRVRYARELAERVG